MKILFVCLGNICRSPLAEGILKEKCNAKNLDWLVDSAGTGNWHVGKKPHHLSIEVAKNHAVDISTQKARVLKKEDILAFDYVFALDKSVNETILSRHEDVLSKENACVATLVSAADDNKKIDVPDPYGYPIVEFEKVYQMLDDYCEKMIGNYEKTGRLI